MITGCQCEVGVSENTFEDYFAPDKLKNNYIVEKKREILEVESGRDNEKR